MATNIWKIESGLCRCCHAEGSFNNLAEPRTFMAKEEIYSDMLRDSLDIEIDLIPGDLCAITYTICNACVVRLRDACNFKKQVLDCEERFMALYYTNAIQALKSSTLTVVKTEPNATTEDENIMDARDMEFKTEDSSQIDDDDDRDFMLDNDDDDISDDDVKLSVTSRKIKNKAKVKAEKKEKATVKIKKKTPEEKPKPEKRGNIKETFAIVKPSDYKKVGAKFACNHCDSTYSQRYTLLRHIKSNHYKLSLLCCPYCEEQFKSIAVFTVHKLNTHNVDDRLSCNACQAKLNSTKSLKRHMKVFHMLGRKYHCKSCDFETHDRPALNKHLYKHKTVKDYHCRFCKKSFLRKGTLNFHEKIHTNERNKVCKICGQAFVQKASLNYHMAKYHPEVDF